jgi:hypothetical protein
MAFSATYLLRSDRVLMSAASPERRASIDDSPGAVALDNEAGGAYNEEAFRYFLEIERKRAALTNRPLLLLLVDFQSAHDGRNPSGAVCAALTACLRDTDFVGWYQGGRVLGAVLTQRAETPASDASRQVTDRVNAQLALRLPHHVASRLQVRVFELAPRQTTERPVGDA